MQLHRAGRQTMTKKLHSVSSNSCSLCWFSSTEMPLLNLTTSWKWWCSPAIPSSEGWGRSITHLVHQDCTVSSKLAWEIPWDPVSKYFFLTKGQGTQLSCRVLASIGQFWIHKESKSTNPINLFSFHSTHRNLIYGSQNLWSISLLMFHRDKGSIFCSAHQ